jgi:hypothetical protein
MVVALSEETASFPPWMTKEHLGLVLANDLGEHLETGLTHLQSFFGPQNDLVSNPLLNHLNQQKMNDHVDSEDSSLLME